MSNTPQKPETTTYKSYVRDALRTESDHLQAFTRLCADPRKLRLLHAVMGLVDEAGELNKALKNHLFYGANLDLTNLKEEGGDLFWFLALLADVLGEANFTNMLQKNIAKLRVRYPEKFEEKTANNRDLNKEREALTNSKKHRFEEFTPGDRICAICREDKSNGNHLTLP